jgi:Domain of unknown function (DUF309)
MLLLKNSLERRKINYSATPTILFRHGWLHQQSFSPTHGDCINNRAETISLPSPLLLLHSLPSLNIFSLFRSADLRPRHRLTGGAEPLESPDDEDATFDLAVKLFDLGEFYRCHDVLEDMWHSAEEPVRTLLHDVLQCSVGFHHLLNQVSDKSLFQCAGSDRVRWTCPDTHKATNSICTWLDKTPSPMQCSPGGMCDVLVNSLFAMQRNASNR